MRTALPLILALPLVLGLAGRAPAGPPCICWPIEIGDAKSIPWGESDIAPAEGYDARRVVQDTLALLDEKTPVLVRMETLRRAALTLDRAEQSAGALLQPLMARALDAVATDEGSPALPLFDAGYAWGALAQAGLVEGSDRAYRWVRRANEVRGGDPSMELALALLTLMGKQPVPGHDHVLDHLRRAEKGAAADPLLARNLALVAKRYPPLLRHFEGRSDAAPTEIGKDRGVK